MDIAVFSGPENRRKRRESVNLAMDKKINEGKDCFSCVGYCCTFEHNSMQITPLEAMDAYSYLLEKGLIGDDLIIKLKNCIKDFRLDKDMNLSGAKSFRRYYTCPFYSGAKLGCGIDRDSKPYGCLAFNPNLANVSMPGSCQSHIEILESQSSEFSDWETKANKKLQEELDLHWNKIDLPRAILILIEKLHDS